MILLQEEGRCKRFLLAPSFTNYYAPDRGGGGEAEGGGGEHFPQDNSQVFHRLSTGGQLTPVSNFLPKPYPTSYPRIRSAVIQFPKTTVSNFLTPGS